MELLFFVALAGLFFFVHRPGWQGGEAAWMAAGEFGLGEGH